MTNLKDATRSVDDSVDNDPLHDNELSGHIAFQQQLAKLLDQADITEEERQQFLIAASCPCCGGGGLSLSLKLKSEPDAKF